MSDQNPPASTTPAQPAPAPPAPAKPAAKPADDQRRSFLSWILITPFALAWLAFSAVMGLYVLGTLRFLYPNVLTEPSSKVKVGFPDNYEDGKVVERYKDQN